MQGIAAGIFLSLPIIIGILLIILFNDKKYIKHKK